jgi:hypothetical protein
MATAEQCAAAVRRLAEQFRGSQPQRARGFDRTVSAEITDLGLVYRGHLHDGELEDITSDVGPRADIRLTMSSDDLLALADGELALGPAWLSGRVKVRASFADLLRLRAMA